MNITTPSGEAGAGGLQGATYGLTSCESCGADPLDSQQLVRRQDSAPADPGHRKQPDEVVWRRIAARLRVPYDLYRVQRLSGNHWCSYHRRFEPAGNFGQHAGRNIAGQCREGNVQRVLAWRARQRRVAP